eukprot:388071_1
MINSNEPNAFCVGHTHSKGINPSILEHSTTLTFSDIHSQRHHQYMTSIGHMRKHIKIDMKSKEIAYKINLNPLHSIQTWINIENIAHFLQIYCIFTLFWNGNHRHSSHAQNVAIFHIYFAQIMEEFSINPYSPSNIETKMTNFEKLDIDNALIIGLNLGIILCLLCDAMA